MRTIFTLTAIAACAIATPSFADEEGDWTGAYAGLSVGYNDAKSDQTVALGGAWTSESAPLQTYVNSFYPNNTKVQDINYGAQLSYNMQTGGGLVLGLEAEVTGLSGSDTASKPLTATTPFPTLSYASSTTFDPKVSYGIKAKLGFASGKTLFYATGGWGWTNADIAMDITSNGGYHKVASTSHTFDGYQIGGGIEQKLGSNMSVRLDYTYTDQGDFVFNTAYTPASTFQTPAYVETFNSDLRMHMIRLGVNFHF
jgi:outer membrane immunogenic protein